MQKWMLNLSGGAFLAGAVAVAVKPNLDVDSKVRISTAAANDSLAPPRAADAERSRDAARTRSSRTDVSLATRFRPRGSVTVGGHVNSPGQVTLSRSMTLVQAIAGAGGATEFGTLRRVKLCRDGEQKTFDVTKSEAHTMILQDHDAVEVPQKMVLGS